MAYPYEVDTYHFDGDPIVTTWVLYTETLSRTAALSVLIYERFIILEDEVDLIWLQRKRWITFLYFFISWLGIVWIAFRSCTVFGCPKIPRDFATVNTCALYILGSDVVALLMTLSVQVVLQLRVWAIYERSRKIKWFLTILFVVEILTMVSLMVFTVVTLETLPIIATEFGCAFQSLPHLSSLFWISAIVVEPILCMLVLKKAFGLLNSHRETSALLARDSLVYFFAILAELLSMLVAWLGRPLYIKFFFPWTIAIPSLFGCRLLLNIRKQYSAPRSPEDVEMAFA